MENISFLKKVLMSGETYWLVAKKNTASVYGSTKRLDDHIMLISLPVDRKKNLSYEEITLKDLEDLNRSYIDSNIYINADYPPFQLYQTLHDVHDGFPITGNVKSFLIEALSMNSSSLYEYRALLEVKKSEVSNG